MSLEISQTAFLFQLSNVKLVYSSHPCQKSPQQHFHLSITSPTVVSAIRPPCSTSNYPLKAAALVHLSQFVAASARPSNRIVVKYEDIAMCCRIVLVFDGDGVSPCGELWKMRSKGGQKLSQLASTLSVRVIYI